jgi:hypothetical protein
MVFYTTLQFITKDIYSVLHYIKLQFVTKGSYAVLHCSTVCN